MKNNKLVYNVNIDDIGYYGDIYTPFTIEDFRAIGVDYVDTVKVSFLDKHIIVPLVHSYRCTHSGGEIIVIGQGFKNAHLIAFHSNFVKKNRIAVFLENEEKKIDILINKNVKLPITFTFELYEKNGYAEQFKIYDLKRSNERSDYQDLTDEEYCNFRNISVGRIKPDILFRSSSPINDFMNRALYADNCLKEHKIKSIINLSDDEEGAKKSPNFFETYYSKQNILFLNTNADITSYNFGKSVLKAIRFIINNEGPYLIHCMEGQDRTGAVAAIFESLLGASKNELINDYMKTYQNFYNVIPGSEQFNKIIKGEIQDNIASVRGFTYNTLDVLKHPVSFLRFLDLTDNEIELFIKKLSK